jgi:uncharacterized protein YukE
MNRDQLADWLHCLENGMYDWVQDEIRKELAKPEPHIVKLSIPNTQCGHCGGSGCVLCDARFLPKPASEFYPDWDTLKPYHERIAELEAQLAQPEQEPAVQHLWECLGRWSSYLAVNGTQANLAPPNWLLDAVKAATAPPRKPWQGLTSEDWENTPDTGKQGCERDAELFDWVEQTLKDKNDTI